ncbi:hypothetical protein K2X33_00215 [bacterium]|nr:hypothetical protein [bacterium]
MSGNYDQLILKIDTNGRPVSGFGSSGFKVLSAGPSDDVSNSAVVVGSNLYAVGRVSDNSAYQGGDTQRFAVSDGSVAPTVVSIDVTPGGPVIGGQAPSLSATATMSDSSVVSVPISSLDFSTSDTDKFETGVGSVTAVLTGNGTGTITADMGGITTNFNVDVIPDADGDMYGSDTDCDDSDPTAYPGAAPHCGQNADGNCDGLIDLFDDSCDDYVKTGLLVNLDAVAASSTGTPNACADTTWYQRGGLTPSFSVVNSTCSSDGFEGSGIDAYFRFDGSNDYVAPSSGNDYAGDGGDFSVEAWVIPSASFSGPTPQRYDGVYGASYPLINIPNGINGGSDTAIGLAVGLEGIRVLEHSAGHLVTPLVLDRPIGNSGWTHVMLTYGTDYKLFVNGSFIKSGKATINGGAYPGIVLGTPGVGIDNFGGYLAIFRVYDSELSSVEVTQNYNATVGRFTLNDYGTCGDGTCSATETCSCADCASQEVCTGETDCIDSSDGDGDGDVDCDDSDCYTSSDCSYPESCSGGADEDGDGDIDCIDSDCLSDTTNCPLTSVCDLWTTLDFHCVWSGGSYDFGAYWGFHSGEYLANGTLFLREMALNDGSELFFSLTDGIDATPLDNCVNNGPTTGTIRMRYGSIDRTYSFSASRKGSDYWAFTTADAMMAHFRCQPGDCAADSDFDGVCNGSDSCVGMNPSGDTDGDGTCNDTDPCPSDAMNDSDGDGSCDSADLCIGDDTTTDADSDGYCNDSDPCIGNDNVDADADGRCTDSDNCPVSYNPNQEDIDADGSGDVCDLCVGNDSTTDSDGDGKCNDTDPCPLDLNDDSDGDTVCDSSDPCPADLHDDSDGDGSCDSADSCPSDNPNDPDGDGICQSVDPCPLDTGNDSDGDGSCDSVDPCPSDPNDDSDGDGSCDSADACPHDNPNDPDGDGICQSSDPCPLDSTNDSDGDSVCDSVDPCPADNPDDSDGDSICQSVDPCPLDMLNDSDGDGYCDSADPCPSDSMNDSDGDGTCDSVDICVGNDGSGDPDGDGSCSDMDPCPSDFANDGDADGYCASDECDDSDAAINPSVPYDDCDAAQSASCGAATECWPVENTAYGLLLDASQVNAAHGNYACSDDRWYFSDRSSFVQLYNVDTSCSSTSGWRGDGSPTNPYALVLDGTDDYGFVHDTNGLSNLGFVNVPNGFTVEMWVHPAKSFTQFAEANTGNLSGSGPFPFIVRPTGVAHYIPGTIGVGIAVGTNGVSVFEHAANHYPDPLVYSADLNGWEHLIITYGGTNGYRLYRGGVLVHQGLNTTGTVYIGNTLGTDEQGYGFGSQAFAGKVGYLKIEGNEITGTEASTRFAMTESHYPTGVHCTGNPGTGDSDADGVCDDEDPCGNNSLDSGEDCDDGLDISNCSSCACDAGYGPVGDGTCALNCGDGDLDSGEDCDDAVPSSNCTSCACNSGYATNGDGTCSLVPTCGNGIFDSDSEICDDAIDASNCHSCLCSGGLVSDTTGGCGQPACTNGHWDGSGCACDSGYENIWAANRTLTPVGIVEDSQGNIFIADYSAKLVHKYNASGGYLTSFGAAGAGGYGNWSPTGMAIDGSDNIYVTESSGHSVRKFDTSGNLLLQAGSFGSGDLQFNNPAAVAVSGTALSVLDAYNYRVQVLDTSTLSLTAKWTNHQGTAVSPGQFVIGTGIAIGGSGQTFISDSFRRDVQDFDQTGNYLGHKLGSGFFGTGDGEFAGQTAIATDSAGYLYVSDQGNYRIQVFDTSWNFVRKFGAGVGTGDTNFEPHPLFVSSAGNIYIGDVYNGRVLKYDTNFNLLLKIASWGVDSCTSICGNGTWDAGPEECERTLDPNCGSCMCDSGYAGSGNGACHPIVCGDTYVDTGENCDDGNAVDGDGCSSSCIAEYCGDAIVNNGEVCDDMVTAHCSSCACSAGYTSDGSGNCPSDGDGDGVPDTSDVCSGNDSSGDPDGDHICNDLDNCDVAYNDTQQDQDSDGVGDVCDDDVDGDGYQGALGDSSDCNDADASIHPAASEVCGNGQDDDCDGDTDEDC